MSEDEVGTIHTLNAYKEVMTSLIQQHHGRVVDAPGDNVLAEFASVVDAVECAVEIQKELKTRNAELPEKRRMEFRIGINLGDVIQDGEQILGDGVNIAARLESLSQAGGICISGTAFDQIENKLGLGYEYLGEQTVKNLTKPVRVYRVLMETEAMAQRGLEVASKEKMAFPMPDLPSIAVLPFENMSGDPKQEFFSDGITETIITALSKVPNVFVIARNSTFTYKGKPVKVKQVSEEVGVRYVLEGSVQRSGDRIRINAQLIDALTGRHIWAERYDSDLKDLFALQDEITIKILTAIQVKLTREDRSAIAEKYYKGKQDLDCWLKIMEGFSYLQGYNIDSTRLARWIAEETVEMSPENPMVYVLMSFVNYLEYWLDLGKSPRESIEKGIEAVQKALAMDDSLPTAHSHLSLFCTLKGEHERAITEGERGVALNPGGASALGYYGMSLLYGGRPEEAIPVFQKAVRLNPIGESFDFFYLGHAYRVMGRFEEAVSEYKKSLQHSPDIFFAHVGLAATYSMMGQEQEARAEAAEVLRLNPKFSVDSYAKRVTFKDQSVTDKYMDALCKAGLK
jgi:adenylate cyclase